MLEVPQASPWAPPHVPLLPQTPEAHCAAALQAAPLAPTAWQAWLVGSQKLPVGQSLEVAQMAEQLPVASQMPERHSAGATHAAPVVAPHLPSLPQAPAVHCAAAVHASPLARPATHAPAWQKVPSAQLASTLQPVLQAPLVQATRQSAGLAQAPPVFWPQRPSLPQMLETHWVALVHAAPLSACATHAPPEQALPAPQLASATQLALHLPDTQAPARHSSPEVQVVPVAAPHRPSAAHTPPRQSALEAHAVPPGRPQWPSEAEQTPVRQSALEVQAPVTEPHLPSASQVLERQAASAAQVAPLSSPQRPSGPQAPPRHCAWLVQAALVGWPQRSSAGSHTPAAHTAAPVIAVQAPPSCSASVGMGWPTASFAVHVPVADAQKLAASQSASSEQPAPPAGTQVLEAAPQAPERQSVPALSAVQVPPPLG
jgi:hypothetical protein